MNKHHIEKLLTWKVAYFGYHMYLIFPNDSSVFLKAVNDLTPLEAKYALG